MKIAFEGKCATNNATGLGNYSRNVVNVLSTHFPDNDYIIYSSNTRCYLPQLSATLEKPGVRLEGPQTPFGQALPGLWRLRGTTGAARYDRVDLFHGLTGMLPLNIMRSGIPSVVTINDLVFRTHPKFFSMPEIVWRDFLTRKSLRHATRVITTSQATGEDIVHYYGVDPGKIDVVYQCCNPRFNPNRKSSEIEEVKHIYGISGRYIICVGNIEERKNQLLPLRALASLPQDISLVIVGRRTPYADRLERFAADTGLTPRLRLIDRVDFRHLPDLYAGAIFSAYTSVAEGFGLSVLEAIKCGTPVIVASGSCLEETGGPDTLSVDPNDVEGFVNSARSIIDEPAKRRRIVDASQLYVSRFNSKAFAESLMATYSKALGQ